MFDFMGASYGIMKCYFIEIMLFGFHQKPLQQLTRVSGRKA